jgi:hypothetical protein
MKLATNVLFGSDQGLMNKGEVVIHAINRNMDDINRNMGERPLSTVGATIEFSTCNGQTRTGVITSETEIKGWGSLDGTAYVVVPDDACWHMLVPADKEHVMQVVVSQFFLKSEISQVICGSTEEARSLLEKENAKAAKGWRWRLSPTNFITDDGTEMDVEEANTLRRACGVSEW